MSKYELLGTCYNIPLAARSIAAMSTDIGCNITGNIQVCNNFPYYPESFILRK
jgi:hypothetical protein